MSLLNLTLHQVRNIQEQKLEFSPKINLLYGCNGSGKTSILEAIYLLGMGRSFRTTQVNHVISRNAEAFFVEGQIQVSYSNHPLSLRMQKTRTRKTEYFLSQTPAQSLAELAQHLPVQLLNLEGYQLLAAEPESRRKFIDWMMFHVEHSFFKLWQDFHRVLRQRNAVLKGLGERSQLSYWTEKLAEYGQALHEMRARVLREWELDSLATLTESPGIFDLQFDYEAGWNLEEDSYAAVLQSRLGQDLDSGYTTAGPHRSDFKIRVGDSLARNVLSTGQQKTFVSMLLLAQCQWVAKMAGKTPILLVDDLPSELDSEAKTWLMQQLLNTPSQVFLTTVDPTGLEALKTGNINKMFHVEHGKVEEVV